MGTHMKTTLEISDPLLRQVKAAARREGTTVRALVERGLRLLLEQERTRRPFRLPDASVKGQGIQPQAARMTWEQLRALSYEGRGG
jgi:hypothetical protein